MLLVAIGLFFGLVLLLWCFVLALLRDNAKRKKAEGSSVMRHELRLRYIYRQPHNLY